ncbi:MAG: TonB-dependent receptor [Pseudomonadota bacterium]
MLNFYRTSRPMGVAALFLASSASGALAQSSIVASDAAAADGDARDIVIVTASKRAQSVLDAPLSVDVLTGETLDQISRFNGAEELTQLVPGLQAAVANGTQIAFQIRGIGAVDHQALTPGAAAVNVDGVFLATNVQTGLLTYDLAGVEVLKGPQGVLYGRNASSGAINFLTNRPGPDQSSYVRASYGRFDRIDVTGAVGGALGDNLYGRIAGRFLQQDPSLDNVQADPDFPRGPEEAGGLRDEFGLRGSLLFDDGEKDVLLRLHYEEDNGINPAPRNSSLDVGDHEIAVGGDGVQDTDNEFYGASLEINGPFGAVFGNDVTLTSLTAVEGYNQQYGFDFDGSQAPFGNDALNANLSYDRDFLQVSQEFRLQMDWSRGTSVLGVMGAFEDFSQDYLIWCGVLDPETLLGDCAYVAAPARVGPTPASPGVATSLLTQIEQDRDVFAVFTQHDIALTDRLFATVGARLTHEAIEGAGSGRHIFDDGVIAFNNRDGVDPAIGGNRIDENRVTGQAALRYRIDDRSTLYVSYGNGYKSGGFNGEVQNNATHFQDEGLFGAETVNAVEIGYKARPNDRVSASAALFYQDYDAPQARIFVDFPLPGGGSIVSNSLANLDAAVAYGFEGDLRYRPTDALELGVSGTLLDTEIRQETGAGATGNAALFDGNPLPFASDVSVLGFLRYEIALAQDYRAVLRANAKYQSQYFLDAEGLQDRSDDGYTTIDASATLFADAAGLEIEAWGRNLLDEDYAVSGFGFIGYNTFRSEPRTYGVSIAARF